MRAHKRSSIFGAGLLGLATLSVITCTADTPDIATGVTDQAVINPPLPGDLNLILNAKNNLIIGPSSQVSGDVASSGLSGSVLFDVSAVQGSFFSFGNVLATTVTVRTNASVGHVWGNDITVDGFASQQTLGLDPTALAQVPAVTPSTPGTVNVSTNQNQAKQLCPGQYNNLSLGINSTLNLNGGVYQVNKLTLADGARLEPSEPVVIFVTGGVTTGTGAAIRPSAQSIGPMTAADIRIEVGGAVSIGDSSQVRAHLLAPNTKVTTGKNVNLSGAVWAKNITIGASNFIAGEGALAATAPAVPPPCNDNNACTADTCVGGGTATAFCRNAPLAAGTSCEDGNVCDGVELCDGAGKCQPGTPLTSGASCADGNACNGDETCDGAGTCLSGPPPEVNDRNACTSDSCDPATGVAHDNVPDGTTCSGVGSCQAGVCSVQGTVFSQDFPAFGDTTPQCNAWNDFLFNQLSNGPYSSVTMNGTFDQAGVTCSDPSSATQICQAMHNGSSTSVFCNGHTWSVGQCGGVELSVDQPVCFCDFGFEHDIRACIGFGDWGGVGTQTCGAPAQNITVVCQ